MGLLYLMSYWDLKGDGYGSKKGCLNCSFPLSSHVDETYEILHLCNNLMTVSIMFTSAFSSAKWFIHVCFLCKVVLACCNAKSINLLMSASLQTILLTNEKLCPSGLALGCPPPGHTLSTWAVPCPSSPCRASAPTSTCACDTSTAREKASVSETTCREHRYSSTKGLNHFSVSQG